MQIGADTDRRHVILSLEIIIVVQLTFSFTDDTSNMAFSVAIATAVREVSRVLTRSPTNGAKNLAFT